MEMSLTKQEIDFIFNTLMPLNLGKLKDGEYKSKLKLFFDANNPNNLISLDTKLKEEKLTKEQHYEKTFKDTIDYFFLELRLNGQKQYFSKVSLYEFKTDILYLLTFNQTYHFEKYNIAVHFYIFLGNLYETFFTLEEYDRLERESYGTAFMTSNYKDGLKTHLKDIRKQLDSNQPFSVVTELEQDRLNINKLSVKTFSNHIDIANYMITMNAMYNFEDLIIDFSDGHKTGFEQSFDYLNGLKTSKDEIIRSFMIKAYFPYYKRDKINKSKLARIVHKLSENFFSDIVYIREGGSYTIGLSPKVFHYNVYIKTALIKNTIYAYDHKKEYTWLVKGSVKDALTLIRKMYLDEGHDEIVNNPLFNKTIKKIIQSPVYPL